VASGTFASLAQAGQFVQVIEEPDGDRLLELNEGQAIHSLYKPGSYLTGRYWDGLMVLPFAALDEPPKRVAILGNAAGTAARMYSHYFPNARVDGVEIDPELLIDQVAVADHPVRAAMLPSNMAASFSDAGGVLYAGGDPAHPKVGELRVSYRVVPLGEVSLHGRQRGNRLSAK
jgi:hypothetical protein